MKNKQTRISKITLKGVTNLRTYPISFLTYCKATAVRAVWHWQKKRPIDQETRV